MTRFGEQQPDVFGGSLLEWREGRRHESAFWKGVALTSGMHGELLVVEAPEGCGRGGGSGGGGHGGRGPIAEGAHRIRVRLARQERPAVAALQARFCTRKGHPQGPGQLGKFCRRTSSNLSMGV